MSLEFSFEQGARGKKSRALRRRSYRSKPLTSGSVDTDGGHEFVGASAIVSCDAASVFDLAENIFDLAALSLKLFAVGILGAVVLRRWDIGADALALLIAARSQSLS